MIEVWVRQSHMPGPTNIYSMKNLRFCINEHKAISKSLTKLITSETKKTLHYINEYISLNNIDIIIAHEPENVAFGTISGFTQNKHTINVDLNVTHKNFKKEFPLALGKILAHELYHAIRNQKNKYPSTLLESCLDEGLAVHFEQEVFGGKPPHYAVRLNDTELAKVLKLARKEFSLKKYIHDDWFFGENTKKIPKSAGYCIGYYLVKKILKDNLKTSPSKLVAKNTKYFLSKLKKYI